MHELICRISTQNHDCYDNDSKNQSIYTALMHTQCDLICLNWEWERIEKNTTTRVGETEKLKDGRRKRKKNTQEL